MFTPLSASRIEDRIIGRIDAENRHRPPKVRPDHPRSPAACQFAGGVITAAIAENAEAVSLTWRKRMLAARRSPITA